MVQKDTITLTVTQTTYVKIEKATTTKKTTTAPTVVVIVVDSKGHPNA